MKKRKIYSSYDEIDRDLQILDLERKISYQKMRLMTEHLKDDFNFLNLAKGLFGVKKTNAKPIKTLLTATIIPFLIKKIAGRLVK